MADIFPDLGVDRGGRVCCSECHAAALKAWPIRVCVYGGGEAGILIRLHSTHLLLVLRTSSPGAVPAETSTGFSGSSAPRRRPYRGALLGSFSVFEQDRVAEARSQRHVAVTDPFLPFQPQGDWMGRKEVSTRTTGR